MESYEPVLSAVIAGVFAIAISHYNSKRAFRRQEDIFRREIREKEMEFEARIQTAEIEDRAQFRTQLMEEIKVLREELLKCHTKHNEAQGEINSLRVRIIELEQIHISRSE